MAEGLAEADENQGILLLRLQAQGHACHSGYPHLGHSANHTLVTLLADILKLEFSRDPLLGPSSVNVGTISGGEARAYSQLPPCSLRIAKQQLTINWEGVVRGEPWTRCYVGPEIIVPPKSEDKSEDESEDE